MTERHRGCWGVRRGMRALGLCVIAASALAFVFAGASTADVTGSYVATLDVSSVQAGSPITVTIKNCSTGTEGCSADSGVLLGSVNITVTGAGLGSPTIPSVSADKTWSATPEGDTLKLRADAGQELTSGEFVSVQITPTKAGAYTVETAVREGIAFDGGELTNAATTDPSLSVTPGPFHHFTWTIPPDPTQKAGSQIEATVEAHDQYDNLVTDYGGTPTWSGLNGSSTGCNEAGTPELGGAHACAASYPTFVGGKASGFTGFQTEPSGTHLTVADSTSAPSTDFTVEPAALGSFRWTGPADSVQTAGVLIAASVSAYDVFGNLKTDYVGTGFSGLSASPSGCEGGAPTPGGSQPCPAVYAGFSEGTASGFIDYGTESSPTALKVTDGSITESSGPFTVDPAALGSFDWTGGNPGPTQTAGSPISATVKALDLYGNLKTNYSGTPSPGFSGLHDSQSGCTGSGTPMSGGTHPCAPVYPTFAAGTASGGFIGYRTEPAPDGTQLTIADGTISKSSTTFTVNPAALGRFDWTANPAPTQTAGVLIAATVKAYDVYGNLKTDYAGSGFSGLHPSPSGCDGSGAPTPGGPQACPPVYPGFASGIASGFTDYRTESSPAGLSITDGTITAASTTFTVGPAALASFDWTGPAATQTAGGLISATVRARDLYGNLKTDYNGTPSPGFSGLHNSPSGCNASGTPTSGGLQPCPPVYPSFTSGIASNFTDYRTELPPGGTQLAIADGTIAASSATFTVGPAALGSFSWTANPAATQTAGNPIAATVEARDLYGNFKTDYNGTPSPGFSGLHNSPSGCNGSGTPTSGGLQPCPPVYPAFVGGTASGFTGYRKEQPSTQLKIEAGSINASSTNFTILAATPTTLRFTRQPTETQVNAVINLTLSPSGVRVEAKDAYGNLADNKSVNIALGSNPGGGTLSGTTSQTTDGNGVATFGDLKISAVGVGKTLIASAPSPSLATVTSVAFIIAQTVTSCSGTCNGSATVPSTTLNVSASGTVTGNTLGIALIGGVTQPAGVCPGFAPAVGSPGSFVNVNFIGGGSNAPSLTITWTLPKAVVNLQPDNGAAHYNMCLGSVNLDHPNGSGTNGYPIKAPASCPGKGVISTACPVADATFGVTFFWGILPDCPKKTLTGPCVVSRGKNSAGDLIFVYTVPYPWDPNGHLG